MLNQIKGLHHVTSLASDAARNNSFFTDTLGLRRVKKTVNFDAPDVYHLYYGDEVGTPGSVMTYFPFPNAAPGTMGTGEVGVTRFAIPKGTAAAWTKRLSDKGLGTVTQSTLFGDTALNFTGPDGDAFALIESDDPRTPWTGSVSEDTAIRGFHSATLRLDPRSADAATELLQFMGYDTAETQGDTTRLFVPGGNAANLIDIDRTPLTHGQQGAGSVHHIAFAVENRARQLEVREALMDTGYQVTPVIDRDYFWAIYFRIPGGVLFEIATNEPGFDRDEDTAHLGEALKLPAQHEHLRARLERHLQPLVA